MKRVLLLLLALALVAPEAMARGFQAKTGRDTLSTREVERPLVIGRTWLELGLGTDVKNAVGYWDAEGEPVDFEHAEWLYTTQRLDITYGVARRGQFRLRLKSHYVALTNDTLGTDNTQFGVGDPSFGYTYEVFRSLAPLSSVVVFGDYKTPLGNEVAGNMIGSADTFERFVMTTGTPSLTFGARAKRQIGPAAITVGVWRAHQFSRVVRYLIETDQRQFGARILPGSTNGVDGELLLQLGPLAVSGGAVYGMREVTKIGTSSAGLFPNQKLEPIDSSDGWTLDAVPGVVLNLTRGVDIDLSASIPLHGEDLQFFPIEDIHPTRGVTYSGTVELRY